MILAGSVAIYEYWRYRKRELDFKRDEVTGLLAIRVDSKFNLRAALERSLDCYRVVYDLEIINRGASKIRMGHCTLECHLGSVDQSWLNSPKDAMFAINHPGEPPGIVDWTESLPVSVETSISGREVAPGAATSIKYGFLVRAEPTSIFAVKCEVPVFRVDGEQKVIRRFLQWRPLWNVTSELTGEEDNSVHTAT